MDYIPITKQDEKEMFSFLGIEKFDDLFKELPEKLGRELELPKPMSEIELKEHMEELSRKNNVLRCFRGSGAYNHFVPSVVNHILLRGELFTAYTPYQPEVSQGTLQAIYEFQTLICILNSMDVANASMYDGATAVSEAMLLSRNETGRDEAIVVNKINPEYEDVLKTYADTTAFILHKDLEKLSDKTACVIVQQPDYNGSIEDFTELSKKVHEKGALFVVITGDPTYLALFKPPGEQGADVVVGDIQALGNGLCFGGPSGGYMTVREKLVKRIPGRLCGITTDNRGGKGFMLTLQAREQHIRRHRATSNICTNQALNALASVVYLSVLGKNGFRNVAIHSYNAARELEKRLKELGFELVNDKPFYNEFVVKSPVEVSKLNKALEEKGFLGGVELGEKEWLLCCTEMNKEQEISEFVNIVRKVVEG